MSDYKKAPADVKADRTLDAKGLSCPMPLLRAKKEIDKVQPGQILEILGTDPGSRNDIPGWATRAGHEWLGEIEEQGYMRYFIRRGK